MKIIAFKYNRSASAVYQLAQHNNSEVGSMALNLLNSFITNKRDDRKLCDEASNYQHERSREYVIPGAWQ